MNKYKPTDLIAFEKEVIAEFKKGETYGPVHLSGGNEEQLIEIFKQIKPKDWVFSTHRSHYHALLKSEDKQWLMKKIIIDGESSHINSNKYKIFTSAIVGGIINISLGTALAIKLKKQNNHVYAFVGDMASEMGYYYEAIKYAENFDLPITFIVEDNSWGCSTPTKDVWGKRTILNSPKQIIYNYERIYPHYGINQWVEFKKKKIKSMGDYQAYKIK
jgi:pyruvate dehydrogenase E1 component alpha subunit